eukprot:22195_1
MASKSVGFFALVLHVSLFLLIFCSDGVTAWQSGSRVTAKTTIIDTTVTNRQNPSEGPEIMSSPRRKLLFLIPKMAATTATATVMLPHQILAAPAPAGMTADSARGQWRSALTEVDDLLQNWSTDKWAGEVGGGDAIRKKLGTQGATSPLYQIEKAFKVLGNSDFVDDFVEFQETAEEFMDALYRADSLASSSNNKTGSGSQTPPAVFIEQSKVEVVRMQSIAKKMNAMA